MNPEIPKHQKIITSKSYYETLTHETTEIEKIVPTTIITLEDDVLKTLAHLHDGASQLTLTVKMVKGEPRLTKRYMTTKIDYSR
jgi:hypothetical protein